MIRVVSGRGAKRKLTFFAADFSAKNVAGMSIWRPISRSGSTSAYMMTVLSNDDCLHGGLLPFLDFFFGGIAAGERG